MWMLPRTKYVCIPCRIVLREAERCPVCRGFLKGMYNFQAPRKRDDRGWERVRLIEATRECGLDLCPHMCCVPVRDDVNQLTLSQLRSRVRKRLRHRQGEIPKHYGWKCGRLKIS